MLRQSAITLAVSRVVAHAGWLSSREWSERDGIGLRGMQIKLNSLVRLGSAKVKVLPRIGVHGQLCRVPHYWIDAISPSIADEQGHA